MICISSFCEETICIRHVLSIDLNHCKDSNQYVLVVYTTNHVKCFLSVKWVTVFIILHDSLSLVIFIRSLPSLTQLPNQKGITMPKSKVPRFEWTVDELFKAYPKWFENQGWLP